MFKVEPTGLEWFIFASLHLIRFVGSRKHFEFNIETIHRNAEVIHTSSGAAEEVERKGCCGGREEGRGLRGFR